MNMVKRFGWLILVPIIFLSGCKTAEEVITLKAHDEILIFNLSYDLTYLRVMEAIQATPDWDLALTQKEQGYMTAYNTAYSKLGDSDQRKITFLINRVNRGETSVQISPEHQRVPGGGALMEKISASLGKEY